MEDNKLHDFIGRIFLEKLTQKSKWGQQDHDLFHWMAILGEEFGECCEAALRACHGDDRIAAMRDLEKELVQVAAVAWSIIECIERDEWGWGNHARDKPTRGALKQSESDRQDLADVLMEVHDARLSGDTGRMNRAHQEMTDAVEQLRKGGRRG